MEPIREKFETFDGFIMMLYDYNKIISACKSLTSPNYIYEYGDFTIMLSHNNDICIQIEPGRTNSVINLFYDDGSLRYYKDHIGPPIHINNEEDYLTYIKEWFNQVIELKEKELHDIKRCIPQPKCVN